jgi:glycosyltransferase involved in cell wall biosynthesis
MLKTVLVAFYEVYPPTFGSASVAYHIAKFLPGERTLVQVAERGVGLPADVGLSVLTIPVRSKTRIAKALRLIKELWGLTSLIKSLSPNLVLLEGGSWAFYDLVLIRLLRIRKVRSKIIYHAHNVEYLLRKQKDSAWLAAITKCAEGRVLRDADDSFAVSARDAGAFYRIYGCRVGILPNGVDVKRFDEVREERVQVIKNQYGLSGTVILFMGLSAFLPNKEALDFLVRRVFPGLVRDDPSLRLAVIGGDVPYSEKWLINPGRIPFEDVPAFVKACDIGVAPIFSGSGTRLKILEFMAAGKPVIATPKGAEGLDIRDGETILLAETAAEFVERTRFLLQHTERRLEIGAKGRDLVKQVYDWPVILEDFRAQTLVSWDR